MNGKRTSLGNRILAMLLVAVMVLGMVPTTVFADSTANPQVEGSNADTILAYAQGKLDENHDKTGQYTWDTEKKDDGWRYFNGLMLEAFLRNGLKANATENALTFAQKYFDHNVKEGSSLSNAVPDMAQTELDGIPPARVLAQLVGHVGFTDAKYANAVELIYKNTIGQQTVDGTDGNFIHKENNSSWKNWQIGLDGLYMAQPFLMETAKAIYENRLSIDGVSASSIADGVYARFNWVSTNMKYETTEGSGVWLYHHGWGPEGSYKNGNGVTWSRGVGWYAAGLADCIVLMEDIGYDSAKVSVLKGHLKTLLDGMLAYQDADTGLWNNVVYVKGDGVPSSNNFLETSGTGLMAYTLLVAYTEGWLGKTYGDAGVKAIDGIMSEKYEGGKFIHILKSSGVETSASGYNSTQSSDEAKGTGAIILAASMYDDAVAGTSYAETYQIGLVNVTELDVIDGKVQTSGLKATVVGSKGTIKDVAAAGLTTAYDADAKTVAISYGGNVIATVDANVTDLSANVSDTGSVTVEQAVTDTPNAPAVTAGDWIQISAGSGGSSNKYVMVDAPTVGKDYVIANGTRVASIAVSNGTATVQACEVSSSASNGIYTLTATTGSISHWQVDASGHLFTMVGNTPYYIYFTGTSTDKFAFATDDSNLGTEAEFTVSGSGTSVKITNKQYSARTIQVDAGGLKNGNNKTVALYELQSGGESKYAALVGTATYAYAVTSGNTADDVLAQIQSDYKVQTSAAADGANASDVAWNDSTVSYSWDTALDTTQEGTYTLTVKVDGKEIGKIPVLVYGATVEVQYDLTLNCTGVSVEEGGKVTLPIDLDIGAGYSGYGVAAYDCVPADTSIATFTDGNVNGVKVGATEITITLVELDGVAVSGVSVTVPVAVTEKTCEHDDTTSVTAPTCTKQGYTTHTCSKCGYTYDDTFVAATGHSFGAYTQTKAATCGAVGEQTATCATCGAVDAKAIPATGEHSWGEAKETPPDCTTDGFFTKTCSVCNAKEVTEGTASQGHNYVDGTCSYCGGAEPGYVVPNIDSITAPNNTTGKATVTAGGTLTLTANIEGEADIRWTSSNNEIATVENGVVTAHKAGTVTITATLVAKTRAIGDSATFTVTVYETTTATEGEWKEIGYTTIGGETTGGETKTVYELVDSTKVTELQPGNYVIVYQNGTTIKAMQSTEAGSNGRGVAFDVTISGTQVNFGSASADQIALCVWTVGTDFKISHGDRWLRTSSNDIIGSSSAAQVATIAPGANGAWSIAPGGTEIGYSSSENAFTKDGKSGATGEYIFLYKETTTTSGGETTGGTLQPVKWAQLTSSNYTVTAGTMTEAEIEELVESFIIKQSEKADHSDATAYQGDYTIGWDKTLDANTVDTYTATVAVPVTGHDTITSVDLGTITVNVVEATVCKHTNATPTAAKDATCAEAGNTAYWTCENCGKYFSDADCTTEITADSWVTEKLAHNPAAAVEENRTEASCTVAGSYDSVVYCSECDAEISRTTTTIPATGHTYGDDDTCDVCGHVKANNTDYKHDFTADGDFVTATGDGEGGFFTANSAGGGYDAPVKGTDGWYDYYIVDGYTAYYKMESKSGNVTTISFTAPADGKLILKMKGRNQSGAADGTIRVTYGSDTKDYSSISKTAVVTETLEGIKNGQTVEIKATAGQPGLYYIEFVPEAQYHLVGSKDLTGYEWDTSKNPMIDNGDGTWSITFNNVPAGTHEYKVFDGTTWYGDKDNDHKNYSFTTSCPADVTLTFDTNTQVVSRNVTLKHSYTPVVTAPTCTEGGYTTYTCACGNSYTADETAALGHDFNENNVCGNCQGTRVFLVPSNLWKTDGARFAVYYFVDNSNNGWYSMLDDDSDGVYEAVVPDGYATMMFVRMNPANTTNNWENDWNQTSDLTTPTDGKVYYTMPESWDGLDNTYWAEPPHVHELTHVLPKGASCTEDGYYEHYTCECGKYFDKDGVTETTVEAVTIKATGAHTGGVATCLEKAVCTACGQEYGEKDADNHESDEFTYTDNGDGTHDKAHACCDVLAADNEAHSFVNGKCACGQKEAVNEPEGEYTEIKTTTTVPGGKGFVLDTNGVNWSNGQYIIVWKNDNGNYALAADGTAISVKITADNQVDTTLEKATTDGIIWTFDNTTSNAWIFNGTNYLRNNDTPYNGNNSKTGNVVSSVSGVTGGYTINLENKGYYLVYNGSTWTRDKNSGNYTLYLYEYTTSDDTTTTTSEYYAISPITATYDVDTEENIANAIKARIALWKATAADGTDATEVDLPENLTVDTSAVKVNEPGTYNAIVKLGDVEIGTVPVTINEVEQEVTYTYAINGSVGDVVVGGEPNFGNITVTKTGSDGSSVTIENADLTFGAYSTEEAGEQTVEVTADGKVVGTVKFTVAESAGELTVIVHPNTLSVPRHGFGEIHVEVSLNGQPIDAGDYTLIWTSENPNVATVTQSEDFLYAGIVYGVSLGATNITATVVYTDANGNVYNGSATTTTTTTTTTTESVVSDPVQVDYALSGGDRTYNRVNTVAGLAALDYSDGGAEVILVFNQGSNYAANMTDGRVFNTQRISVTANSDGTYKLAPYSTSSTYARRWVLTKGETAGTYYISTTIDGTTYYLSHAGNTLAASTDKTDALWNVQEANSSGVTAFTFYYIDGGKYYQMQGESSKPSISGSKSSLDKSSNKFQAVVYSPNEVGGTAVYTYARVDGITSYVIEQGDTLTEAMILEKIKVQLESSSNPGVWEDLAWTDSRINYNWRGVGLDTNTVGRYAMAIRVNNQLVHRVFVNVEPAAYTVEINSDASVTMESSITATATVKDSSGNVIPGATVTWSSSNPAIASVDAATGVITGKINGDATITATYTIGGKTYTASKKITVTSKVNYEKYIQNLTTEGFEDNLGFYTFSGNHNPGNADPITYKGSELDTFMKMESSTDVYFTADADGEFVVIAAKTSATVKLTDGSKDIEPTIVTENGYTKYVFEGLTEGTTYHLKKDSSQALVAYWEFIPSGNVHEVIAINIELVNDENELILNGTPNQAQAKAEVTSNGNPHDDADVVWGSEDESVVTVSETGLITAVGVGQTYVTASHTHTYSDGSTDTYTDRYLVFVLDGSAITSAELSTNTVTFDKGQTITKADFNNADGSPITLTLIQADGTKVPVEVDSEDIDLGDLDGLTDTAGTKTVLVSYKGTAYLPITVKVVDQDMANQDGIVQQEVNVIYSLDIDGIDDGKQYVLVAVTEPPAEGSTTWKGVALLNPNDSTSNTKGTIMEVTGDLTTRTITFTGTAAEIANAKEFGLWTFDKQGTDSYLIINTNRNFRDSNSSYLTKADNDKDDAVTVKAYTTEGAYYFNLGSSNWLSYYDGAWVRTKSSSADDTVYLFERISETAAVGVDFVGVTEPVQNSIHKGNTFTSVPTVHVGGVATTDYTIEWTSSDASVATVDANGKVSYIGEGTATITATLTHIGGEVVTPNEGEGLSLSHSFDVTVPLETTSLQITPDNIVVPLNGTVDLSEVRIVRVRQVIVNDVVTETIYEDLESDLITFDLVGANNKLGIDTSKPGESYEVDTYYDGVKQGTVTVNIGHDVFDGRDTATSLPEYPAGGAVRVDKTAVSAEGFSFLETGVAKVEISAAGVTQQSDIDVILVVDVSNSMAWSMDWFEGLSNTDVSDAKKIPTDGVAGIDKLDMAMTHASTFADILLEDGNNSLTFVTFAGCDTDNGGSNYDSVQTVFTGVTDASKAKTSFAGTRYTALSGSDGVTVTLQVTDENGNSTKGTNRGNTNYDYAFGQAMSAIRDMKDQWEADSTKNPNGLTYEESGRQIHVVFMTDGAPSHYNGVRNGGSTSDTIYGTSTKYSNKSYSDTDWTAYIQNPNTLATQLYNTPGVTGFHTVGFDLAHGGFGSYSADATEMTYVLRGLVTSQDLDVVSAENEAQLQNFFESLAHSLTMAGRSAFVTDIVGADYTLYMGTELLNDSNGDAIEGVPSEVNVKLYTLVTPTLIAQDSRFDASQIGRRVCDIVGEEITSGEGQNVTVLETITFNNGVPTSSETGELTVVDGGFKASTFEYKVVDGKGNITWTIGDITHQEISLSYYAHLNGVADHDGVLPENGSYYTNESAHITYIDANDDKAVQEFPKPAMAFGSASVRFRFVLVTEDGRYANSAGNAFAEDVHANRIFATEEVLVNVPLDQVKHFTSEDLKGLLSQVGLSSRYLTLASNVSFDIGIGNVTQQGLHNLVYTNIYETVWSEGEHEHNFETLLNVTADDTYTQVTIELPVVSLVAETAQNRLFTASTVIDFGTPVDFEIAHTLEKEAFAAENYVMTVVGFAPYSASFDQKLMIKPELVGAGTKDMLATESGVFSIKTAGDANNNPVITFTPTAPINGVQKVFATIRFSIPGEETTSYYYMYKEINVIPANMMLVESDAKVNASGLGYSKAAYAPTTREFATGFTYTGSWELKSSGTITNQSNANENYGYDAGYANYAGFAGNVMYVNSTDPQNLPTVSFSFTGTGFDLISSTGMEQGMIAVHVYQNGKEVNRQVVLLRSVDSLYQIPVVSVDGLSYGQYDVTVIVNSEFALGSNSIGGQFHFDGIRVYNAAMNDSAAVEVYKTAGENNMILQEIRDLLLAAKDFTGGMSDIGGAFYLDNNQFGDQQWNPNETNVTTYEKIGPKNEIYLSGGQAVAFKLGFSGELPTTLDLGLKLAKVTEGNSVTATVTIYNADDLVGETVVTTHELKTATAMFYNILGNEQLSSLVGDSKSIIVVISYGGDANLNDILSITDLKAGFSGDGVGSFQVISNTDTVAAANLTLNPEFNVKSAQFASDHIVAMQNNTLTVVTSAGVESILVTDENGNEVGVSADYMDTADGDRVWTVLVRPTGFGECTFVVTGVGADGQTGEATTITANVDMN